MNQRAGIIEKKKFVIRDVNNNREEVEPCRKKIHQSFYQIPPQQNSNLHPQSSLSTNPRWVVQQTPSLRRPLSPTPHLAQHFPTPWPAPRSPEPASFTNELTPESPDIIEVTDSRILIDLTQEYGNPRQFPAPVTIVPPNHRNLLTNPEDFVCSICEVFVIKNHGAMLRNCSHCFCRICLTDAIEHNKSGDILCPMALVKCEKPINDDEIQALLSPQAYHQLLERVFNMNQARNTDTLPSLLQLEETEFVETKLKFECEICMSVIRPGDGITLKNCLHEYCKTCLVGVIEASEELEIRCPFVAGDGSHCEGIIQDREMRSLMKPEVYEKYLMRSLERAEATTKSFHCKTVDCPGWAEYDETAINFYCPVCLKTNCIKCKVMHEGKTCTEYYYDTNEGARKRRDDELTEAQVQALVKAKEAMPCPRCGVIIQKTTGCNHMKCSRCQADFQWLGRH